MKIEVGGLETFVAKIKNWEKDLILKANQEVLQAAMRTVALAKVRLQPLASDDAETAADIAAVRSSINYVHDRNSISSVVFAGNTQKDHFAAYLEFGTGPYAAKRVKELPFEWEMVASQFYVNGKGTMPAHPYLADAYIQEGNRFVENMKKLRPRMQ
ncbi:hypothetical protein LZD49_26355 [Dyadobacter sp. CY261]|uniref:HK97-gp10 family putative phage morphogenesis protein n=1 Tax=Dyadobacter sp. CY261 TaxID=2907203 RepID=UPI001F48272C|nr:HK97-gp10 family putative phage morphogenesis protein [Dyadobacter sp. CY261]MCF0074032.1 hypothetical protein [Dyadobacter sp. CY261]